MWLAILSANVSNVSDCFLKCCHLSVHTSLLSLHANILDSPGVKRSPWLPINSSTLACFIFSTISTRSLFTLTLSHFIKTTSSQSNTSSRSSTPAGSTSKPKKMDLSKALGPDGKGTTQKNNLCRICARRITSPTSSLSVKNHFKHTLELWSS